MNTIQLFLLFINGILCEKNLNAARFAFASGNQEIRVLPITTGDVSDTATNVVGTVPDTITKQFEVPMPYSFGYDYTDQSSTRLKREEEADGSGTIKGSYSYIDADGLFRSVEYIADSDGFRASVRSNEPGLAKATLGDPASTTLQLDPMPDTVSSRIPAFASSKFVKVPISEIPVTSNKAIEVIKNDDNPKLVLQPTTERNVNIVRVTKVDSEPVKRNIVKESEPYRKLIKIQTKPIINKSDQPLRIGNNAIRLIQPNSRLGQIRATTLIKPFSLNTGDSRESPRYYRLIPVSLMDGVKLQQAGANVIFLNRA